MTWKDALTEFAKQNGKYIIPKKGTPEYDKVKEIQSNLGISGGKIPFELKGLPPKMKQRKSKLVKLQQYDPELDVIQGVSGSGFIKDKFVGLVKKVNNKIVANLEPAEGNIPLEEGEIHAKKIVRQNGKIKRLNYNYAGPGTKLEKKLANNVQPIDGIDAAAKQHDIDYTNNFQAKMKKGIKVSKKEVQQADEIFVNKVKQNKKDNPVFAAVIPPLFAAKKVAENTGVLNYTSFFDPGTTGAGMSEFRIRNTRREI